MSRPPVIAYLFERYPVLSQTFLRREIAGLLGHGIKVKIQSLFPGADDEVAPIAGVPVHYFRWWQAIKIVVALPRELWRDPRLLRDGWKLFRQYPFPNRENFWATVWAIIFAFCEAPKFRQNPPDIFHGVRATGPATAAALLSRLCGIPFTFGAHAYDIYRDGGDAFLETKFCTAAFVHTSTETAAKYLRERFAGATAQIIFARRGLDYLPPQFERDAAPLPIRLLSVGRLVEKKGHTHQIAACELLKSKNIPFSARIVGDGPLHGKLQLQIECAGLKEDVELCGALSPELIDEKYRWADIFWHTGIVDEQGDRDGLPNVIPEAFAHDLPVISNHLPATTEALSHEVNGLVVNTTNAAELAQAVERLAGDFAFRQKLGENGRRWVEENFLAARNTQILARAFESVTRPSA
jgi:colanic acid/amylovoran biosynthesis glycosyltransferase